LAPATLSSAQPGTLRQVLDIIVQELNLTGDPPPDQPLFNAGTDSLDSINIQVALEDAFDVRWSPQDDVTPHHSPQKIAEELRDLIDARSERA